jgi:hypothetical protein
MKEKTFKYEHKASTKEYLVALAYTPFFTKLLNPENKSYHQLFEWLIANASSLSDEDKSLPSIKEIAAELKTDSSKISKNLKLIYQDIHSLNEKSPDVFKKEGQKLCYLSFNYLGSYAQFNLGLDVIPRIGEAFHFWFVKPINGGTSFHVNDVVHSYDKGVHETWIYLSNEYPNGYLQLLKEKAYLHHDISFSELISVTNFSLEEKLVQWHKTL